MGLAFFMQVSAAGKISLLSSDFAKFKRVRLCSSVFGRVHASSNVFERVHACLNGQPTPLGESETFPPQRSAGVFVHLAGTYSR